MRESSISHFICIFDRNGLDILIQPSQPSTIICGRTKIRYAQSTMKVQIIFYYYHPLVERLAIRYKGLRRYCQFASYNFLSINMKQKKKSRFSYNDRVCPQNYCSTPGCLESDDEERVGMERANNAKYIEVEMTK